MANSIRLGGGGSGSATLITKAITQNGTYLATDDNADGYSEVEVDVAGGSSSKQISYLKWHITNTRSNPEGNAVQLSEFYLYLDNVLYNWNSNVSVTASLPPYSAGESIDHIIDGSVDTKYVTTSWGSSYVGQCDIVISLGETITVDNNTSYAFATGNDEPSRDPVGWVLFGSSDGSNWFALDARNGANVPTTRKTSTEKFSISVGGGGSITKTLEYSFDLSQGGRWIDTQVDITDIDILMFEREDNDNITMQTIVKVSDIAVYTGGQDVYSPIYRQDNRDMNARIYNNVLFVSYNGTSSSVYKTNVYSLSISDYIT